MPLDYMLSVMRDSTADAKRRDAMAIAAAPYLHPKLTAVDPKPNEPETSEGPHIRVTFVRPRPRLEPDDEHNETSPVGSLAAKRTSAFG